MNYMVKNNVYWQCPKCDKEYNWKWGRLDCICGPIHVICEECGTEFKGEFVWAGDEDFEIVFPSSYKENKENDFYLCFLPCLKNYYKGRNKMNDLEKFDDLYKMATKLKNDLDSYTKYCSDERYYDKVGLGFNKDRAFSAFRTEISLDSWVGNYKNSSCSKIISIADTNIFQTYLLQYLNKNVLIILDDIIYSMEKDLIKQKNIKIKALKDELVKYESLGSNNGNKGE